MDMFAHKTCYRSCYCRVENQQQLNGHQDYEGILLLLQEHLGGHVDICQEVRLWRVEFKPRRVLLEVDSSNQS